MTVATLLVAKKDDYQSYLAGLIVLALACYFAVQINLQFVFASIHVSLFDIATGVAVGGLVVYGVRYWPGVFFGVAAAYLVNHESLLFALFVAIGIMLEGIVIAYLLRHYLHQHYTLDYMPELLTYFLISTAVTILFGATFLSITLMLYNNISYTEMGFVWLNASLGKITGIAVIAPFVMVWSQKIIVQEQWYKFVELICLISLLLICGGVVFFGWFDTSIEGYSRYPLAYLFFPILAWSAFRFGQRISTAATLVITSFALWSLANNLGPFSRDAVYESHFLTWMCINVAAVLAMILSADITQCKKVRVALQKSDERLDLATSGSQDGLWDWVNIDGEHMWWSPNFYDLLEYKKGEIESSHMQLVNLMHEDDRDEHLSAFNRHVKGLDSYNIDYRLLTKTQGYRWFHAKGEVTFDQKNNAYRMAGSIIDIHDRKLAQHEITELNKSLEKRVNERTNALADINEDLRREIKERNKAESEIVKLQNDLIRMGRVSTMGELASSLAHELHQPLMAIINYSQSVLIDLSKDDGVKKELIDDVQRISEQALRGGEIIRGMKEFSLRGESSMERHDVNELIIGLKPLFDIEFTENNIKFSLQLANQELIVHMNNIQMQQVITNLVKNSIEAMKYNTDDKILILKTERLNDNNVLIEVIDNGSGIGREKIDSIFDSFYTTKSEGLGLGLSISKTIVKAHQGDLSLHNNDDLGATARVTLRLAGSDHG